MEALFWFLIAGGAVWWLFGRKPKDPAGRLARYYNDPAVQADIGLLATIAGALARGQIDQHEADRRVLAMKSFAPRALGIWSELEPEERLRLGRDFKLIAEDPELIEGVKEKLRPVVEAAAEIVEARHKGKAEAKGPDGGHQP